MSPARSLLPLTVTLAIGLVAPSTASAAPAMSTIWQETSLDLDACVKHAEVALHDAGMTKNTQTLHESVYGEQGPYTGSIRCLSGKNIVFIVVAGPHQDRANQLVSLLKSKF
jgi:hypothetical protein